MKDKLARFRLWLADKMAGPEWRRIPAEYKAVFAPPDVEFTVDWHGNINRVTAIGARYAFVFDPDGGPITSDFTNDQRRGD